MRITIIAAVLLLSGCATKFVHPTKTEQEFDQDYYACQKESAPVTHRWERDEMNDRCMKLKGWEIKPANPLPFLKS